MKYQIHWSERAEEMLAAIWLAASDRNEITRVSDDIEKRLETNPLHFGESRESSVNRVGILPPLGILFEVVEDNKKVIVQGAFAVC